jgi:hypothetical protein
VVGVLDQPILRERWVGPARYCLPVILHMYTAPRFSSETTSRDEASNMHQTLAVGGCERAALHVQRRTHRRASVR